MLLKGQGSAPTLDMAWPITVLSQTPASPKPSWQILELPSTPASRAGMWHHEMHVSGHTRVTLTQGWRGFHPGAWHWAGSMGVTVWGRDPKGARFTSATPAGAEAAPSQVAW